MSFLSRFTGKHAAVQSILEKRRADRREVVKRKLEALKQKQNLNYKDNTKHPLAERVEATGGRLSVTTGPEDRGTRVEAAW